MTINAILILFIRPLTYADLAVTDSENVTRHSTLCGGALLYTIVVNYIFLQLRTRSGIELQ